MKIALCPRFGTTAEVRCDQGNQIRLHDDHWRICLTVEAGRPRVGTHLRENGAGYVGFIWTRPRKRIPKQLRGRSLGTRLSEAEYAQCEKSAARRGQTLRKWCCQVLLEAAAGPAQAPEAEVILSEILALRKIVINVLYGDKAGEERMRELIEAADSEKLRKAAERLHAVVTARSGVLSDNEAIEVCR